MGQVILNETQQGDKDRTIEVTVTPTLKFDGKGGITAKIKYEQTGQDPNNENMENRVKNNGDLKLTGLDSESGYTDNVDITFTLDTSEMEDPNKNPVEGRWAYATEYSGKGPVTGFLWFCAVIDAEKREYDLTPINIPGMTAARLDDTQVQIDDNTPATAPDYGYCLGLVLPAYDNYYLTLDPMLGSKGNTTIPPMMLRK